MVCNTPSPLDEQQIQFAIISFSIYRVYDHDDKYVYSFFAQKGRKYILNEKNESELSQRETMPTPWEP